MRFNLLIFSFITKQYLQKNRSRISYSRELEGCDHRYLTTNETSFLKLNYSQNNNGNNSNSLYENSLSTTLEDIYMFNKHMYQLKLLNKLLRNDVSIIEKINEIEQNELYYNNNSEYSFNLMAGGLFNDWNSSII